jgi:translation initiation factor IF-2
MYVVAGESISPVRIFEDFLGKQIGEAKFSSPVRIIGWDKLPAAGSPFKSFENKKEAESYLAEALAKKQQDKTKKINASEVASEKPFLPVILKADVSGSLDAIIHELPKVKDDRIDLQLVSSGIGPISESDVKLAIGDLRTIIAGFNVKVDPQAQNLAERSGIEIKTFDIIYKLTEWLEEKLKEKAPAIEVEELTGKAKILKVFSATKDKQIIGGKVEEGSLITGVTVRILRRDTEIGQGKIRGLQLQKEKITEAKEGMEFGSMIESKTEIAPGDKIESFKIVKKQ